MRFTSVPEDQRHEYSIVFDNLWRFVIEVDPKMTMYAVLLSEDLVRRLIAMVRSPDALRSCPFLMYSLGFDLSAATIVALFQSAEVPPRTSSPQDDDRPSPRVHSPIQSGLGCYEWQSSATTPATTSSNPTTTAQPTSSTSATATNDPPAITSTPTPSGPTTHFPTV